MLASNTNSDFNIQRARHNWIIPFNCELLKVLLEQQQIEASDICFDCDHKCKDFVKKVFLLALEDQTKNLAPSTLAKFGRDLIRLQTKNKAGIKKPEHN